jgi:chromosome partitioning protein
MNPKMTAVDAAGFLGITLQGLHKNLKTKDLAFEKQSNRVFFSHDTARSLFNCVPCK